ncbi:MAG: dipeptidase [Candidatus Methylacidiphilales bacterium]|nr:dipeptidase [Candidatus Methylacidiphilales bacterium]
MSPSTPIPLPQPDAASVETLLEFLRFPSVSTDPARKADTAACAEWVAARLRRSGLVTTVHPTPGHPIVTARTLYHPGRRTVLIYGHYDVQPADPLELWHHDPFEPHIENNIVTARGATDNKGQILAHILGVERAIASGREIPVNLIFLIEGEEEIGSPSLPAFLHEHRENLACDVVAISDTGMIGRGIPTLTYGLRGISCLEITLTGPDKDLHSGIYGGAVANPITELSRLIATLHEPSGRIAIPGFYDDVQPLEDWEREAWARLPLDETALLQLTGSPAPFGEPGYSTLERTWARPTVELNGITGGYQGEGSKTVLPSRASAKFSFRLVPGQDAEKIQQQVAAHLRRHCPPTVTLHIEHGHNGAPYAVNPNAGFGKAAQTALRDTFGGAEPALIREGGSIPIVTDGFKKILGVDTLLLGLALPDSRCHSPNENFPLENFAAGMDLNQHLLRAIAAQ